MSINLRLEIRDLLLRSTDCVGTGDEAARRRLLARDGDERSRELGRVAGLLAVLGLPERELRRSPLVGADLEIERPRDEGRKIEI